LASLDIGLKQPRSSTPFQTDGITSSNTVRLLSNPETDFLSIDFNAKPGADAQEIVDGMVIDLDAEGRPVGIDIQHASQTLDLATLETRALPARDVKLS
jgi:uncharacterized protein YuzE